MMSTRQRYYEVDAARAIVMFIGVLIHSAAVYSPVDLVRTSNDERYYFFEWITKSLNLFAASPTFMIVGGFFTLFLMLRYGTWEFFNKRLLRLAAPLAATGVTFGLVETYLRYRTRVGSEALSFWDYLLSGLYAVDLKAGLWMHQTWFLVVLIVCVFLSGVVFYTAKRFRIGEGLTDRFDSLVGLLERLPAPWFWLILFLSVFQLVVMKAAALIIPNAYDPLVIGPIGFESPFKIALFSVFFLFGVMLFCSKRLFDLVFRWSWPLFFLACISLAFGYRLGAEYIKGAGQFENVLFLGYTMCRWFTSIMFLQIMHRFFSDRPRPLMLLLTDAAMTVYMVHHCFVYIFGEFFASIGWHVAIEATIIFFCSATLSVLFHYSVIAQSGTLRMLFNGQTKGPEFGIREFLRSRKS